MRSPRIAPPVNGDDGSTATIPTVLPRRRRACARRSTSVDLPAPGGPVIPKTRALPARAKSGPVISGAPPLTSTPEMARPMSRARPARTPSRRVASSDSTLNSRLSTRQEALGDDELLDPGRALADRAELDVAAELLPGECLDEPVPARELTGPAPPPAPGLGGVALGPAG